MGSLLHTAAIVSWFWMARKTKNGVGSYYHQCPLSGISSRTRQESGDSVDDRSSEGGDVVYYSEDSRSALL